MSSLTRRRQTYQLIYAQIRDELDYLPVLVSLPPQQTVFEYLVGCWKRLNTARSAVMKKVIDISLVLMCLFIYLFFNIGIRACRELESSGSSREGSTVGHQLLGVYSTRARHVPSTVWVGSLEFSLFYAD